MSDVAVGTSLVPSLVPGVGSSTGPKYGNEDTALLDNNDDLVEEVEEQEEVEEPVEQEEEEEEQEEPEGVEEELPKTPFERPTLKEIKAKYPDFFKDFPDLKESFFREAAFTQVFPTVDDAKEAFTENEAFGVLQESALSGDPAPLLDSIEKTDKQAFELFSRSFLPSLYKKNPELYAETVNPVMQNLVRTLFKDRDENTRNTALVLAQYLYGEDGEDVAAGKKTTVKSVEPTEEQKKLKTQREERTSIAFRVSVGKVQDETTKNLKALILKNPSFDPEKVFSKFMRDQGANEAIKRIMTHLQSDKGHMQVMGARWKRARANGFTQDDESKIISTYLARAKSLIPDACSKVSAAMLGTRTKSADNRRKRVETPSRENFSGRASSGTGRSSSTNGKVDYSKMSDLDILNS